MKLYCFRCNRGPSELEEYVEAGAEAGLTPDQFVRQGEGTLNTSTGRFACSECYIAIGMPSNPWPEPNWTAP